MTPLYSRPDVERALLLERKRGQIVDLVIAPLRDEIREAVRGEIVGVAVNLAGGRPCEVVLRTESGRLVCASSAIVASCENPREESR